MTNFSASSVAGTVVPIVGMGIGLGLLAHTAHNISKTMYRRDKGKYNKRPSIQRRDPRRISIRGPMQNKPLRYQSRKRYTLNIPKRI